MCSDRESNPRWRWQSRIFALRSSLVALTIGVVLSACSHTAAVVSPADEELGSIVEQGPAFDAAEGVASEELVTAAEVAVPATAENSPTTVQSKSCVVLGPGMALAMAQVGVLQALQEAERPIDCLAGIEMGAVVAALFADKANTNHVKWELFKLKKDTYLERGILSFAFKKTSGKRLHELFRGWFGERTLADLKIPLAISAEDQNGQVQTLSKETKVADALSASVALPEIFEPWKLDPYGPLQSPTHTLVFPVEAAQSLGATNITLVNVLKGPLGGAPANGQEESILAAYHSIQKIANLQLEGETTVMQLDLSGVALWDIQRQEELFQLGLEGAQAILRTTNQDVSHD